MRRCEGSPACKPNILRAAPLANKDAQVVGEDHQSDRNGRDDLLIVAALGFNERQEARDLSSTATDPSRFFPSVIPT